jgi:tRNA A-37 threonylcarbamoyl transferase component Bud32
VRSIGQGGAATVYLARQLDLDRLVALKELKSLFPHDPSVARRFLREARVAGALTHPNIVTVHEYFEQDGVPYIAMEYLQRGSLRPFMPSLTPQRIGGVLEGVLGGLAHAERHGVVHRDIKPENLLVTDEGTIKIADFGIARATRTAVRGTLTVAGLTVGTPSYMAPEQAAGREVGPWTDLYSVGVTTFEMLVGRTPFAETTEPMALVLRHVNEQIPRVTDVAPRVPAVLSDWVAWLVDRDPAARPQTAMQAWEALEEALISLLGPRWRRGSEVRLAAPPPAEPRLAATVAPRRTPTAPTKQQPKRRRLRLVTVLPLVAAAVVLAGFGAAKLGGGSGSPAPPATTPGAPVVDGAAATTTIGAVITTAPSQQAPMPPPQTPAGSATGTARTRPAPATTARQATTAQQAPAAQQVTTTQRPETRVAPARSAPSQGSCAGDSGSDDPSDDACSQEP